MEPADLNESNCCCVKIICSQCRHQRDLLQHDVVEDSNSDSETQVTEPALDLNMGKWFLLLCQYTTPARWKQKCVGTISVPVLRHMNVPLQIKFS